MKPSIISKVTLVYLILSDSEVSLRDLCEIFLHSWWRSRALSGGFIVLAHQMWASVVFCPFAVHQRRMPLKRRDAFAFFPVDAIVSASSDALMLDLCPFLFHLGELEEEMENPEMADLPEKQKHQLRHRELFLSRQLESLPATHIR